MTEASRTDDAVNSECDEIEGGQRASQSPHLSVRSPVLSASVSNSAADLRAQIFAIEDGCHMPEIMLYNIAQAIRLGFLVVDSNIAATIRPPTST